MADQEEGAKLRVGDQQEITVTVVGIDTAPTGITMHWSDGTSETHADPDDAIANVVDAPEPDEPTEQ
jgi:hypothetical protein